ncbi:uncharacterized protein UV8b_06957 [Ustilaginoidea virens]|uniref:Uncharacterized protein n=1 Tax=Ustilaginoidea virens TaxID=1159556 RepID=A0A8E5MKC0_USTVR|nr:uncharacterized protein UV8b_06957 [Ustilaginoidea virens]QUC22716.1 hypothetical protein UV8b_06957 [Ustilaginoidea virens]
MAAYASAHMLLANPAPYDKSKLTNGPLLDNGSDFPCKVGKVTYSAEGASNVYPQGSSQKLEFTGSAVHGGGSCQLSVTTDLKPNKNSVWKVIKSIHGGCPAKNTPGNLGDNPSSKDPFTYDFTIPKEMAAGNYTLAWTWFNRIGNREMYMNCAPLTVTGSGGSSSFLNTLPDMFVANVNNGCTTVEGSDVIFPNPGKDVDSFGGAAMDAFKGARFTGNCQKPAAGGGGGGSGSGSGSGSGGGSGGGSPPASPPASSAAASPTIPGGVFITQSQPAETQPAPTTPAAVPTGGNTPPPSGSNGTTPPPSGSDGNTPPPSSSNGNTPPPSGSNGNTPPPSGSNGNTPPPSGSSGAFPAGTACSPEGQWNCVGGTAFQRCASGQWSAAQPVAHGTSCSPGQASELKLALASKRSRRARRARRALRFVA